MLAGSYPQNIIHLLKLSIKGERWTDTKEILTSFHALLLTQSHPSLSLNSFGSVNAVYVERYKCINECMCCRVGNEKVECRDERGKRQEGGRRRRKCGVNKTQKWQLPLLALTDHFNSFKCCRSFLIRNRCRRRQKIPTQVDPETSVNGEVRGRQNHKFRHIFVALNPRRRFYSTPWRSIERQKKRKKFLDKNKTQRANLTGHFSFIQRHHGGIMNECSNVIRSRLK